MCVSARSAEQPLFADVQLRALRKLAHSAAPLLQAPVVPTSCWPKTASD